MSALSISSWCQPEPGPAGLVQRACRQLVGSLCVVCTAMCNPSTAQSAASSGSQPPPAAQVAPQASTPAAQASAPLSECPSLSASPLTSAWCSLTQASPVLQSVQILLLGLLGIAAIGRTVLVHRRRRAKLHGGSITKVCISIETSRLTSITDDFGTGWFVAGFSGNLWKIDSAFKGYSSCTDAVGLIRCLLRVRGRDSVLLGGDDGVLHVFDVRTSSIKRLATLGSPIYRLATASDRSVVAALGSGEVALLEIQHSPGQGDFSFRELWRTKAHEGSAFDVLAHSGSFVSVGADGHLVEIDTTGKLTSSTKVTDCTIWSIAPLNSNALVLGCNDGTLIRIDSGVTVAKSKSHQSAVRQVLRSPKGEWCISLGKDRSVFATRADLSASVLLHRSRDYLYDGCISDDGQYVVVCDGAGDVTRIHLDRGIDNYDHPTLAARTV
jgi:WD40 repeat protein